MKYIAILFALLGVASATYLKPGIRAKFSIGGRPGIDYFYNVSRSISEAMAAGWTQVERPPSPLPSLVMYCTKGLIFCALYDPETGSIAGVQIGIPLNRLYGAKFDWYQQGFIQWIPVTCNGEMPGEYMTKQMYFISEETLKKSREERVERSCGDDVLTEGAVWLTGFKQELVEVSMNAVDIENSIFTKQACIPQMGRHFFYNMSTTLECTALSLFNWFLLVHNGRLNAVGFATVGKVQPIKGEQFWLEPFGREFTEKIVPRGSECFYKIAENPSYNSLHIYFVEKPWLIDCEGQ